MSDLLASVPSATPVIYCNVCGNPPDFCENLSRNYNECINWLINTNPELIEKYNLSENVKKVIGEEQFIQLFENIDLNDDEKMNEKEDEKEDNNNENKSEEKNDNNNNKSKKKKKKKNKNAKKDPNEIHIVIEVTTRKRRKHITNIHGLEGINGIKLKKVAKHMGQRFACGSSVSTLPSGEKIIMIQGDAGFDVPEQLVQHFNIQPDKIFTLSNGREQQYTPL